MTDDEENAPPCPVCRVDLVPKLLLTKQTEDATWARYQFICTECDYRGETWELMN